MKFAEALNAMTEGKHVALPGWKGYWAYDKEQKAIIAHTASGVARDIRNTDDIIYTVGCILTEAWKVVDEAEETDKQ